MKSAWRVNFVFLFFFSFFILITGRMVQLQIFKGDFYRALAEGIEEYAESRGIRSRGEVFLSGGEPLAVNKNFPFVFAAPLQVYNPEEAAKVLASIIALPESVISEKLQNGGFYSLLKKRISQEESEGIKKAGIKGIYLREEKGRFYPQGVLASNAIGFVDADFKGRYGLEEFYDDSLSEQKNLILTIDYNIQFTAEKLLRGANSNLKGEGGEILVLDPNSGKILALASFPDFDPNRYGEYAKEGDLGIFQNGATRKIFEPGSVFKAITMAAALEEQKVSPQTKYVDKGILSISGYTISNYNNRIFGEQTMTDVLEKSINTGAVFAERQLGNNLFLKYIEKFGFFEPTGVDLPEVYSKNKELKNGYDINFATASFGQGIAITPIQLVRAYAAIANGGKLVRPYAVEGSQKENHESDNPVISPKTSSQLTAMLVSVIENGFGKAAKIDGYHIAGKTGTAQVPEAGKYSSDKTVQSFIGFFPAFSPRFLILVKLDNPQTKTAEYSALPIFKELAKYIIDYMQIPPDYDNER